MKHANLFKKIMAFTLAALIGLSALSGLIMAFATTEEDSLPEVNSDGTVYLPADEDWELVRIAAGSNVTVELEDAATLSLSPQADANLWLGWTKEYSTVIDTLSDRYNTNFDVVDFIFDTKLETPAAMTFTSKKPYLYAYSNGELTPIVTEYKDGIHSFKTDTLTCFLAADSQCTGL